MHPVLHLIKNRKASESAPNQRTDGNKLGLVIEGGAMRGLVTSAMATAIECHGMLNCFDVVYGTSAGAFNGAYLIAGQSHEGGTIYYEDINNPKFIDLRRLIVPGKTIMNLEYLVYDVVTRKKILDCQKIIDSPIPLVMLASSATELKPKRLRGLSSPEEIKLSLLASARMPGIAGGPVECDGDLLFDGGVLESIAFHSAIEEGCTHILVFLSRPAGQSALKMSRFESLIAKILLRKYPRIEAAMRQRLQIYPGEIAFLYDKSRSQCGPPFLYAVQPPAGTPEVNRLERSRNTLLAGARSGFETVYRLFCEPASPLPDLF